MSSDDDEDNALFLVLGKVFNFSFAAMWWYDDWNWCLGLHREEQILLSGHSGKSLIKTHHKNLETGLI